MALVLTTLEQYFILLSAGWRREVIICQFSLRLNNSLFYEASTEKLSQDSPYYA